MHIALFISFHFLEWYLGDKNGVEREGGGRRSLRIASLIMQLLSLFARPF